MAVKKPAILLCAILLCMGAILPDGPIHSAQSVPTLSGSAALESARLARLSEITLEGGPDGAPDPQRATLLAIRALKLAYSPYADAQLRAALAQIFPQQPLIGSQGSSAMAVAFSPEGRYAAVGSGGLVWLWDVQTHAPIQVFSGHSGTVTALTFSHDGRFLLTGSADRTARLWNVQTGQMLHVYRGHRDTITGLALSADDRSLATGSADHTVRLWDVQTGVVVRTLTDPTTPIKAVAFSPDGRRLFVGADEVKGGSAHTLWRWDIATDQVVDAYDIGSVLAFSPDGRYALGTATEGAQVWDMSTVTTVVTLTDARYAVAATFSPDSHLVLIVGPGSAQLWDARSGHFLRESGIPSYGINYQPDASAVAFSPDGRLALSGSEASAGWLWELSSGDTLHVFRPAFSQGAVLSPDGRYVLSGDGFDTVWLWELRTGQIIRTFHGPNTLEAGLCSFNFSPDGRYFVVGTCAVNGGGEDHIAVVFDVNSGQLVHVLDGHTTFVRATAYSPDGRLILTGGADGTARLWDAQTGQSLQVFKGNCPFYVVAYSTLFGSSFFRELPYTGYAANTDCFSR